MLCNKEYMYCHPQTVHFCIPAMVLSTRFMIHCKGQPLVLSRPQEPESNFTSLDTDYNRLQTSQMSGIASDSLPYSPAQDLSPAQFQVSIIQFTVELSIFVAKCLIIKFNWK